MQPTDMCNPQCHSVLSNEATTVHQLYLALLLYSGTERLLYNVRPTDNISGSLTPQVLPHVCCTQNNSITPLLYTCHGSQRQPRGRLTETVVSSHSMHFDMKSKNLRAYWSGLTVEISAPAPCLTAFAACAVRFFIPYLVSTSIRAMK